MDSVKASYTNEMVLKRETVTPNTRQQRTAEVDIKGMRGGW